MDLGILCGMGGGDHRFDDGIKTGMIFSINRHHPLKPYQGLKMANS